MNKTCHLFISAIALVAASCATPKNITYFQDATQGNVDAFKVQQAKIKLLPDDKINIIVNTKDVELSNLFNLPYVGRYIGQTTLMSSSSNQGVCGYTIDAFGDIDFPVLGKLHIEGMTRAEVAEYIKEELIKNELVKDAVVTVEYLNLTYSVLGEVNRGGMYNIQKDCTTILDALSMAGDLTIYGIRDDISVIRKEYGKDCIYHLNLCSASDITSSPAFYIKQNDLIYVKPNEVRARQSTVNGNNVRSTSFWISLASLATSISLIFLR